MDWKRVGKVLAEALSPAPNVWDWLQILVLLVFLASGAAVIARVEGVVPAVVVVAVVLAGLFFLAAYRLQGRFDELESRQPMIALREDHDQGYDRLVVKNPNAFTVKRVYVELKSLEKIEARRPDFPAPSLGFRFPWTSWATEGGSLYMNFPPDAEIPVDIAALPSGASIQVDGEECFFFVHLAEKKETRHLLPNGGQVQTAAETVF